MGEVLRNCRWKLYRAERHIAEMQDILRDHLEKYPGGIFHWEDDGGYHNYIAGGGLPAQIPAIIGDIAHNLRSALDHAYFQLVLSNQQVVTNRTQFPFFDTREELEEFFRDPKRDKRAGGMPTDEVIELLLDDIKPFKNSLLWRLHRLNIEDKHKMMTTILAHADASSLQVGTNSFSQMSSQGLQGAFMIRRREKLDLSTFADTRVTWLFAGGPMNGYEVFPVLGELLEAVFTTLKKLAFHVRPEFFENYRGVN